MPRKLLMEQTFLDAILIQMEIAQPTINKEQAILEVGKRNPISLKLLNYHCFLYFLTSY